MALNSIQVIYFLSFKVQGDCLLLKLSKRKRKFCQCGMPHGLFLFKPSHFFFFCFLFSIESEDLWRPKRFWKVMLSLITMSCLSCFILLFGNDDQLWTPLDTYAKQGEWKEPNVVFVWSLNFFDFILFYFNFIFFSFDLSFLYFLFIYFFEFRKWSSLFIGNTIGPSNRC